MMTGRPKTSSERSSASRARSKAGLKWMPKPCGTVAAARRHQRAGEPLCVACRPVWSEHQAAMYRQRKAAR